MVIQRWQSLLLLCACALMACFTFVSVGQFQTQDFTLNFTTLGISYEGIPTNGAPSGYYEHTWYLFAPSLLSAVLAFIAIFCYKNLPLQKRICLVDVLVVIATCASVAKVGYTPIEGATVSWSWMVCFPVVAIVALIMAYRYIQKDHKLLLSVDRLR